MKYTYDEKIEAMEASWDSEIKELLESREHVASAVKYMIQQTWASDNIIYCTDLCELPKDVILEYMVTHYILFELFDDVNFICISETYTSDMIKQHYLNMRFNADFEAIK